jgi:hypothetical protein
MARAKRLAAPSSRRRAARPPGRPPHLAQRGPGARVWWCLDDGVGGVGRWGGWAGLVGWGGDGDGSLGYFMGAGSALESRKGTIVGFGWGGGWPAAARRCCASARSRHASEMGTDVGGCDCRGHAVDPLSPSGITAQLGGLVDTAFHMLLKPDARARHGCLAVLRSAAGVARVGVAGWVRVWVWVSTDSPWRHCV